MIQVALNSPDPDLRKIATERLGDLETLIHIATSDPEASIRAAAVWNLNDLETLRTIELNDEDPEVRCAAKTRQIVVELKTQNREGETG